jgi:asparagine synthase (glutamine-hydrolysing)
MARHSGRPVKTYSVAFAERSADESLIADRVAREFGTEHSVFRAEQTGAEALQNLIGSLDEPFCDPTLVPLHLLSRMTRKDVKVALCGDGADEAFGGYSKYLLDGVGRRQWWPSTLVHRSLKALPWRPRGMGHVYCRTLTSDENLRFSKLSRYGDYPVFRKDLRQLLSPACREEARVSEFFEPWERHGLKYGGHLDTDVLMRADLQTYLSENCLVKTDRASMLASLEVRVPYLDEMVLDRILQVRSEEKIVDGQLKALLLPLARRLLPREVWDRPKHGFNVPLPATLSGAWSPVVEEALSWGEQNLDVFNYPYLRRLHRINLRETSIDLELWNPIVLITWAMAQGMRS